jgi:predicted metal-dependent hydrolase
MWQVELIKAKRKTISMRFSSHEVLVVRYPFFASQKEVHRILEKEKAKIQKLYERFALHFQRKNQVVTRDKNQLLFLGSKLKVDFGNESETKFDLESGIIRSQNEKTLAQWLESKAKQIFENRLYFWAVQIGVTFTGLKIKKLKSKWGSCSSKGSITLNQRLVHAPQEIIDYVIIHELCHCKYFNHSKQFWNLVAQFDPEFKAKKAWLKANQYSL